MKNKNGFTLLELLVVVLIIGILSSIAIPQYQKAVNKARVASILPVMRRWKDALADYKLQHGSYCKKGTDDDCDEWPDGSDLDANWPADWGCGDSNFCSNDYWDFGCGVTNYGTIYCGRKDGVKRHYSINVFQPDYPDETLRNRIICGGSGGGSNSDKMHEFCKGLGGELIEEGAKDYILY